MLADEIRGFLKGEVFADEKDLETYSQDASIFLVKPEVVVAPKDIQDLKNLVDFVRKKKEAGDRNISLTARSGGTDMSGGPLTESIVVDFTKHFNQFKELGEDYAVTEPGVFYRDFENETLTRGLIMPSYPASREICTVGGMVANNSGGEKSLSYGKTENYIEELRVVLSNGEEIIITPLSAQKLEEKKKLPTFEGEIYRKMYDLLEGHYDAIHAARPNVSKNSAGYFLWNVWDRKTFDLNKLIVGSQGTLAMVTQIKFRLVRKHTHSELLVMFLKNISHLGELVDTILPFHPESFESYDDNTLKLAIKFFPDLLRQMRGNLFKLGLQFLPEFWMTVTGGVPKLILIAEFAGNSEEEVYKKIEEVQKAIKGKFGAKCHATRNSAEAEKYWMVRRESFNLLRKHVQGKHTAPFIDDIVVRPHDLPQFLPKLNVILDPYKNKIMYTIAGHAGDGNFHIIPLMDFKDPSQRAIIFSLSDKVYKLVAEFKGSITGEHNDGLIRSPYLEQMYGPEVVALFDRTKEIFDPQNIFNPGKKVGASLEYAARHVRTD